MCYYYEAALCVISNNMNEVAIKFAPFAFICLNNVQKHTCLEDKLARRHKFERMDIGGVHNK